MAATPNCQIVEAAVLAAFPDARFGRYNCFAGDVELITRQGIRTFEDVVGETVTVMAQRRGGGGWVDASVEAFGEQLTYTITLTSSGRTKQIRATSDHRWFVDGEEDTTAGLIEGDWLDSVYYRRPAARNVSSVGVQWGLVFGDGTEASRSARAFIATPQVDTLLPYFGNPRIYKTSDGVLVGDLPNQWKRTMPDVGENQSLIAGFIAGYIAADGRVGTNGAVDLYSANPAHLEQVRDLAMSIGIATRPLSMVERLGYGDVPTPMYNLRFINWTFPPELLIRPEHRGRITASPTRPSRWRVVSVEPYRVEPVFCAVVPEYENFALIDNILTGNCRHIGSNPIRSWSQHAGSEPARNYFANALDIWHVDHKPAGKPADSSPVHQTWLRAVRAFITLNYGVLIDQMLGPGDNRAHANHIHMSTFPKMKSNWWYKPPCKGGTLIVIYEDGTTGDTFGDPPPPPLPSTLGDDMPLLPMKFGDGYPEGTELTFTDVRGDEQTITTTELSAAKRSDVRWLQELLNDAGVALFGSAWAKIDQDGKYGEGTSAAVVLVTPRTAADSAGYVFHGNDMQPTMRAAFQNPGPKGDDGDPGEPGPVPVAGKITDFVYE